MNIPSPTPKKLRVNLYGPNSANNALSGPTFSQNSVEERKKAKEEAKLTMTKLKTEIQRQKDMLNIYETEMETKRTAMEKALEHRNQNNLVAPTVPDESGINWDQSGQVTKFNTKLNAYKLKMEVWNRPETEFLNARRMYDNTHERMMRLELEYSKTLRIAPERTLAKNFEHIQNYSPNMASDKLFIVWWTRLRRELVRVDATDEETISVLYKKVNKKCFEPWLANLNNSDASNVDVLITHLESIYPVTKSHAIRIPECQTENR